MTEKAPPKPKRVRCDGSCGALKEPDELTHVGPKRRLCQPCLVAEAAELIGVESAELPNRRLMLELMPDEPHPDWPGRRGRLSPSSISTFLACPEQFRRKYLLGDPGSTNGSMIAGTAAHTVSEIYWKLKIESEGTEVMDSKTIRVTTQAAFEQAIDEERGTINWKEPMTYQMAKDAAEFMAASYLEDVGPWLEPYASEILTVVRVPGVPIPVVSVADVLTETGIIDTKFGKSAESKPSSYWAIQGLVQQIGQNKDAEWHSISHAGKIQTPRTAPDLRIPRTAARLTIALQLVRMAYRSILAHVATYGLHDVWPGALGHPFACGMCDYRPDCSWWTGQPWLDEATILG